MRAHQPGLRIALKNILFATDFSWNANMAGLFAVEMAKRYGAKIYGVHVHQRGDPAPVLPAVWAPIAEAMEREVGNKSSA